MKYISIAFALLAASANFVTAQQMPIPADDYNTYHNLGACPRHVAPATKWLCLTVIPTEKGGGEPTLTFFASKGDRYADRIYFSNRARMDDYCSQVDSQPCGNLGVIARQSPWPF